MRSEIASAYERIRPHIRRTAVIEVRGSDFGLDGLTLVFKLELLQQSGSFKARGAFANLLLRDIPKSGVVAASGGNHGAAVAFAAQRLGIPARIYVPKISNPAKVERIRAAGAELFLVGERYADALAASQEWAASSNALQIHAFDQEETMRGAGSIGLELEEQCGSGGAGSAGDGRSPKDGAPVDAVLASVGGGGLIGGICGWFEGRVDVIGVEPELAPTLTMALAAGKPVDAPAGGIAADALAPKRIGERVLPVVQRHLKQCVLVADEAIAQAQKALWSTLRIAAEPAGSAALAALLSKRYVPRRGARVAVVISGGNFDPGSTRL
jgi:threonine dehydratase